MVHERPELGAVGALEQATDEELAAISSRRWATDEGDRAFAVLWGRYDRSVAAWARRCAGRFRGLDAQEVASEAQFKIAEAVRTGKSVKHWPAYVSRLVDNAAMDMVRQASHRPATVELPVAPDGGPEQELEILVAASRQASGFRPLEPVQTEIAVRKGLERVARRHPRWAAVLELLFLEGCSIEEAAVRLDLSTKQVGRDRDDGLAVLRRLFAKSRAAS